MVNYLKMKVYSYAAICTMVQSNEMTLYISPIGQGMYLVVLTKNTQNLVIARYDDFFDSNQQLVNGQLKVISSH